MVQSFLDPSTLIAGQVILSILYTAIFLLARRLYPQLRGTIYFACSFASLALAQAAYTSSSISDHRITSMFGDFAGACAAALSYYGLMDYFYELSSTARRRLWAALAVLAVISAACRIDTQLYAFYLCCLTLFHIWLRAERARLLGRHANGNLLLQIFCAFMAFYALFAPNQVALFVLDQRGLQPVVHGINLKLLFLIINVTCSVLIGFLLIFMIGQRLLRDLETESRSDPLTGRLNRRGLHQTLEMELIRAARQKSSLSIALIDIDHFKQINDTWGHSIGDDALRFISSLIASNIRPYDEFGREGGDELIIIMPGVNDQQALSIAERICHAVSSAHFRDGIPLSVSMGIAQGSPQDSVESILHRADLALYDAKNSGRNRVRVLPVA